MISRETTECGLVVWMSDLPPLRRESPIIFLSWFKPPSLIIFYFLSPRKRNVTSGHSFPRMFAQQDWLFPDEPAFPRLWLTFPPSPHLRLSSLSKSFELFFDSFSPSHGAFGSPFWTRFFKLRRFVSLPTTFVCALFKDRTRFNTRLDSRDFFLPGPRLNPDDIASGNDYIPPPSTQLAVHLFSLRSIFPLLSTGQIRKICSSSVRPVTSYLRRALSLIRFAPFPSPPAHW